MEEKMKPRDKAFRVVASHIYRVLMKNDPEKRVWIVLVDSFDEAKEVLAKELSRKPGEFVSARLLGTCNPQIYKI